MLARRFTIVCLLIALFGMGVSTLVAQKSSQIHSQNSFAQSCAPGTGVCLLPFTR